MIARKNRRTAGWLLTTLLYLLVIGAVLPLFWLLSTSLKRPVDAFAYPPKWISPLTIQNYQSVFDGTFPHAYVNSIIISLAATLLALLFGITSGYALARTTSRMIRAMGWWIIAVRMAPAMMFVLPYFVMFQAVGLLDTYPAIILVYLTLTLPFSTWILAGYFRAIPEELEQAARVDGCSRIGSLFRVILPMAKPGLATAAIFAFISAWNEFFYPLVLTGPTTQTASVAIQGFVTGAGINWGPLAAASVLVILPVVVVTIIAQRGLVSGLTVGSSR